MHQETTTVLLKLREELLLKLNTTSPDHHEIQRQISQIDEELRRQNNMRSYKPKDKN